MIELKNVSKQYRGISGEDQSGIYLWIRNIISLTGNKAASIMALKDVSFTACKGEVFGIYGSNGAGKTTLIKILSGLLRQSAGSVMIDGKTDTRHIKNVVSYISTNGWMGLEWQLTARENLILYGAMFGMHGKKLEQKCKEVLQTLGMAEESEKYVRELSAGMRQKITIARGLVLDRPVIFYDEPSVSLDVISAKSLREMIRKDAIQNRRTAIIASHNADDMAICDRIMLLSKGKNIKTGTWPELIEPVSETHFFEINCLNMEIEPNLKNLPGILNAKIGKMEGERSVTNVVISAGKQDFSLDCLIDYFIENGITVLGIKKRETGIQDIYGYYLQQNGEAQNDLS